MIDPSDLRTVKQLAEECPGILESTLWTWVGDPKRYGLGDVVIKVKPDDKSRGHVYLVRSRFAKWLEARLVGGASVAS